MKEFNPQDAIVFAPTGKDAELIAETLQREGISVFGFKNESDVYSRLKSDCGVLIVAEEALKERVVRDLNEIFQGQEPWSDLPIIVLTFSGEATAAALRVQSTFSSQGNVVLLERPFRKATLISTVQVALRSRAKQYQVRELLKKQIEATQMRDEFMAVAGHELRTPLTTLKLHTQINQRLLKNPSAGTLSNERIQKLVETMDRQVNRLSRLVEDMLDVTRVATGKLTMNKERVPFSELVEELVDGMRSSISQANCELSCRIEPKILVFADSYRIEQVINNLITNALRYAPKKPIAVICSRFENFAKFAVSDQGPGISEEAQKKIFERFERVAGSGNTSGLGLGLYISKEIIAAHDGVISVESAPNRGATFTVLLPLWQEEVAP